MTESWAKPISIQSAILFLAVASFIPTSNVNAQNPTSSVDTINRTPNSRITADSLPGDVGPIRFPPVGREPDIPPPPAANAEEKAWEQIAKDFERIQVINNKMMSLTVSAATPDLRRIARSTAEIRTRATRINIYMRLPKADSGEALKEQKPLADAAMIKEELLSLDHSIMSFVKNPIFKNTSMFNWEHAARAGRDLSNIIARSSRISLEAERLSKSLAKSK